MPLKDAEPYLWHWTQAMAWIAFDNDDTLPGDSCRPHSWSKIGNGVAGDEVRRLIFKAIEELCAAATHGDIAVIDKPADETFKTPRTPNWQVSLMFSSDQNASATRDEMQRRGRGALSMVDNFPALKRLHFSRVEILGHWPSSQTYSAAKRQPDYLPPYLDFMLRLTLQLGLRADEPSPMKTSIEAFIRENWPQQLGEPSDQKVRLMATFLRRPGEEGGRNKG